MHSKSDECPFLSKNKDQNSSTWKTPLDLSCRRAVNWHRTSTELPLTVSIKQKSSCTEMPAASSLTNVWACCCIAFLTVLVLALLPSTFLPAGACFFSLLQMLLTSVYLTGDLSCCGLAMSGRQRLALSPSWNEVGLFFFMFLFLFCNVRNVQILEENQPTSILTWVRQILPLLVCTLPHNL